MWIHACHSPTYGGQKTTYGSRTSPSTTTILVIQLRSSELVAGAFNALLSDEHASFSTTPSVSLPIVILDYIFIVLRNVSKRQISFLEDIMACVQCMCLYMCARL